MPDPDPGHRRLGRYAASDKWKALGWWLLNRVLPLTLDAQPFANLGILYPKMALRQPDDSDCWPIEGARSFGMRCAKCIAQIAEKRYSPALLSAPLAGGNCRTAIRFPSTFGSAHTFWESNCQTPRGLLSSLTRNTKHWDASSGARR